MDTECEGRQASEADWLVGGGLMGDRIRSMDWSHTPLGPREQWPRNLRVAVNLCLNSRFPMFVWWGPDYVNIYNDAYVPMLGKRHPAALGRPAREAWDDIWSVVGPQADLVTTTGQATWNERVLLVMERHGFSEETWFTWSYSPIHAEDGSGRVAGMFCAVTEDTPRVLAERERDRFAAQRQLALDAANMGWWHYDPITKAATFDRRYAEIFGVTGAQLPNEEILRRLHPDDLPSVWAKVEAALDPLDPRPYSAEFRVVRDDGSVRWVEAHGLASFEGEGAARRATSFVGTVTDVTERRHSEELPRIILESITDSFFAVDPDWRFTYLNRQAERHLGRTPGDLTGRVIWDEYPALVGTEFERVYRRSAAERVALSVTDFYPDHDRWYEVHAYPAPDGGISVYFRDVSDRIHAEAERDRLAAVVRNSPDFIGIADIDGTPMFASPAALRMAGMDEQTMRRTPVPDFFIPEEREYVRDVVLPAARRDGRWVGELHLRNATTGQVVPVLYDIFRIDDPATGRPTHLATITRDITSQKRAEQQLLEETTAVETINRVGRAVAAELDLGRLVQAVTDATTQLAGAQFGAFFYNLVNDRGESYVLYTLSGVPRERFERFPMPRNTEVFAPTFRGEGVVRMDDVTADPRYGKNAPYFGKPPGHLPVRSYLAVPVISRSGEVLGGLFFGHEQTGVFTERSERVVVGIAAQAAVAIDNARLFDAARRANADKDRLLESERAARAEAERQGRVKDEFLATLSHELRTPLNAILGWSQVLKSSGTDDDDLREGLATIERNARAQAQIVEDLLDMSRIISGQIRLNVRRMDLAPVVQASVETVRPAADAKGVRLHAVLDPLAGPVSGDPNRLQQVFWNLLSNAVKFTPRGGHVQVLLERVNSHLEVSVVDTGGGITADFLPHVFDRFRQADASTTRQHGGLGLGLAIVKQLVELHGGTIRAKSPGAGRGATFTVSLPLTPIHLDPAAQPDDDRSNPTAGAPPLLSDTCVRLSGVRVLVVDDEPDARALVKRLLEDCDATVTAAGSAEEAMEQLAAGRADVLVSDIGMPGEDGYALIRRVRALGPARGGDLPAIALTAYARAEDRVRAILAGYQMHVAKPVEPAELVTMVASLAGRTGGEGAPPTPANR